MWFRPSGAQEWIPNNIKASVCDIPPKGGSAEGKRHGFSASGADHDPSEHVYEGFRQVSEHGRQVFQSSIEAASIGPCIFGKPFVSLCVCVWEVCAHAVDCKRFEHGCRMIHAGFASSFGLGLEDAQVPTFLLLL